MLSGMHPTEDLIVAALWLLITAIACYQWYWQGRRDQRQADQKSVTALIDRLEAIVQRHSTTDPNRPSYLDRQ